MSSGIRIPSPEWRGYAISDDDRAHWAERMRVGELAPEAPVSDDVRALLATWQSGAS